MDKKFTFGVSTSAFQIEGDDGTQGRGKSVWDTFCEEKGRIFGGHDGKVAIDHYNRFKEDVALMAELGVNSYRFSVSWPRVLPEGYGKVNEKGLDFYDRLIDELLKHGIDPFLTEYHWDLPEALGERGGFRNPDYPDWFAEYTTLLVQRYGDRVRRYITYNEPLCAVHASYKAGVFAPGLKLTDTQSLMCLHHFLLGHGKASKIIMENRKDAEVGIAMSVWDIFPTDETPKGIDGARKAFWQNETPTESIDMYMDPIYLGKYPARVATDYPRFYERIKDGDLETIGHSTNILCVNNYTGDPRDADGKRVPLPVGYEKNYQGYVNPKGLLWICRFLTERYDLPLYITENGAPNEDVVFPDGKVHDVNRVNYLARHLAVAEQLLQEKVDLRGYFVWSMFDNFEWLSGYSIRFGLVYVDYETQARIKKDSFEFYKNYIENFSMEDVIKGDN